MKIIGHRGAKGLAPENTLASFKKALEHHVDEIELDVRVTHDGHVILSHDSHLEDQSGTRLTVHASTYSELKKHKPDLATLDEAITAINKRVPIMIEVKPGVPVAPVAVVVRAALTSGWQSEDFSFVSFSFPVLKQLHREFPGINMVVDEMWSGVRATYRAHRLHTKRINLYRKVVWSGFVAGLHHRGYELAVFPLNDIEKARRWQKHGLAGVITDYPDRFEKF
ncbi:MAG TPA: glycerophosphodiester phosphodiesterase [Candidatus Saccharimonadales bacterium]|nr:glycerophosphodiester phosphodiesterase [Candidatus Saccharimonadales bacterium]